MFDSHTHLNDDQLFPTWQQHMQNFIDAGGKGLVNIAVDAERAKRAIHIAQTSLSQFPDLFVWSTIGIHPSEACFGNITSQNLADEFENIKNIYQQHKHLFCGIGECGIDLHYPGAHETLQLQQELLALQCQMAQDTWLSLVIHSRDGFQETIDVIKDFSSLSMVFHCFGYGPTEAEYILSHFPNVYLWFDGNISYPKAQALRDTCLITPIEKILLETDAPYLAPQDLRGTTNTPTNVKFVYEFVAQLKNISLDALTEQMEKNFMKFYE